jgi:cation:H+ antiporter
MLLWIAFIVCTSVIVYAGTRLSKYGDIIAEKTGLGRTWIGVVLMASVTSLPELVTGISSVTYADVPDIAVGDILGSCIFNMLILSFLDAIHRPTPISSKAHHGHVLSAGFGILLLSLVSMSLFF